MLASAKKLLRAVANWIEGDGEDATGWQFEIDKAITPLGSSAFEVWHMQQATGNGLSDWLTSPLALLAQVNAIDLTFKTWRTWHKDKSFKDMTATQKALIAWLNG